MIQLLLIWRSFADVREPIGRPKKRKTSEWSESQPSPHEDHHSKASNTPRRRKATYSRQSSQQSVEENTEWVKPSTVNLKACCSSLSRSSPTTSAVESMSASTSGRSLDRSSYTSVDTVRQVDEQPTLSDLGLAAFLESLETLEINKADGLTPDMLRNLNVGGAMTSGGSMTDDSSFLRDMPSQLSFGPLLDVQSSTSYAVPADLSWADSSWLLNQTETRDNQTVAGSSRGAHLLTGSSSSAYVNDKRKVKVEGPCPRTGKEACCCGETAVEDKKNTPPIHCVPNPNGQGCTCLCDVSIALINVRATLRQTREQAPGEDGQLDSEGVQSSEAITSTLQLTLSASQAVADQCACSASCPTCRADPNTSLSASLLISTALQIYIRAVRTLRQGFASESELDVSLGSFKPKPHNAKRIALFAMKLELRDLRDSIAKISNAAGEASDIDQLVIRKLHRQLDDLLNTVQNIEEQEDANKNIVSTV